MLSLKKTGLFLGFIYLTTYIMPAFSNSPAGLPQAFNAQYTVTKSGLALGEMETTLSYQGTTYTYLKEIEANGLAAIISGDTLTERSIGRVDNQQLSSLQYFSEHKNRRKTRRDQFRFQSPTLVTGRYKKKNYEVQVPKNTVDPALLELQLMQDVANNQPLDYPVTEKGKIKQYQFVRQGQETLELAGNRYLCEKLHVSRDSGKRQTTLWLAPELNYLPVKIRHNEKGDILESSLSRFQLH